MDFGKFEIQQSKLEVNGNYEGDWTLLLQERLLNPEIKRQQLEKTTELISEIEYSLNNPSEEDVSGFVANIKNNLLDAQKQKLEDYEGFVSKIFSYTEYMNSDGNITLKGGSYPGYGGPGILMKNKFENLSDRFKNLVESHEKGHSLRKYEGVQKMEIESVLDLSQVDTSTYVVESKKEYAKRYFGIAEEIIERMSQLKNYFGFNGDEKFTREHLLYAKEHYLKDIHEDASFQVFLSCITNEKEEKFLHVMNTYGV